MITEVAIRSFNVAGFGQTLPVSDISERLTALSDWGGPGGDVK